MKLPCEECITLAICKHRQSVRCNKLYEWTREYESNDWLSKLQEIFNTRKCGLIIEGGDHIPIRYIISKERKL